MSTFVRLSTLTKMYRAELYYAAIRKLKKEEMLKKIKPGYEGNLTMDDVLLKLQMVSKFRFGYVIVCLISIGVFIGVVSEISSKIRGSDQL